MAMTIAVSFLLVVPIEPVFWLMAPFAGLIVGYYANSRAGRLENVGRILVNGLYAGALTAVTMALLFVAVKAIFFFGDDGYPDFNRIDPVTLKPVPPFCDSGAPCVYARYLVKGQGPDFVKAGVTDTGSFTAFYWREQLGTAGTVLALCTIGGLGGAFVYGLVRPRPNRSKDAPATG